MRILDTNEVEDIISRGTRLPDSKLDAILDELEKDHPGVYRVIYGEPSDAIAIVNKDMADLYLNLSFDVVWVFKEQFGKPPEVHDEERWVLTKLSLIDAELKSITKQVPMNDRIRRNLQERFVKNSFESKIQLGLLRYLENEVMKYVSFDRKRAAASQLTTNLLFVLVRLMGDLYNLKTIKSA
jgi:hypothetical protein